MQKGVDFDTTDGGCPLKALLVRKRDVLDCAALAITRAVGLQILREVVPDLIITDLRMPNMSGFEFLSIMRRRYPHVPTIAISGEFILATTRLGLLCDHFFQKGEYTPDDPSGNQSDERRAPVNGR